MFGGRKTKNVPPKKKAWRLEQENGDAAQKPHLRLGKDKDKSSHADKHKSQEEVKSRESRDSRRRSRGSRKRDSRDSRTRDSRRRKRRLKFDWILNRKSEKILNRSARSRTRSRSPSPRKKGLIWIKSL